MKKEKDPKRLLTKISIILSIAAILICMGLAIYSKFAMKDDNILIWIILALSNLSLMFVNISNLNKR